MTRDEIVAAAKAIYNEETGNYISDTYLNPRYNEAKNRLERRTLCVPVSETFNLDDSGRVYILPAGMHAIRTDGALVEGKGPIYPRTLAEIIAMNTLNWDSMESTYPNYFYLAGELITTSGVTNWAIGVYPIPSAAITNGMTLHGWGISDDPSSGSVAPPWPTPHHVALVWELCVMAARRDMGLTGRNARVLKYYQDELKVAERQLRSAASEYVLTGRTLQVGDGAPGVEVDRTVMHVQVTVA